MKVAIWGDVLCNHKSALEYCQWLLYCYGLYGVMPTTHTASVAPSVRGGPASHGTASAAAGEVKLLWRQGRLVPDVRRVQRSKRQGDSNDADATGRGDLLILFHFVDPALVFLLCLLLGAFPLLLAVLVCIDSVFLLLLLLWRPVHYLLLRSARQLCRRYVGNLECTIQHIFRRRRARHKT